MMPDDHIAENARSEFGLAELVGRIGNLYVRQGLSPPTQLRDAAKHWLGLSQDEIVAVIQKHFADHRRLYVSGSGDGFFYMVEAAVRKAWQAKHPVRDGEPEGPRRKRRGRVRPVPHAGGVDIFDDRDDGHSAGLEDDRVTNVEGPPGLPGYERTGDPIGIEDD
jgi:hypothetical protein